MLKEKVYNFIILMFFGILIVYLFNTPPCIIIKHEIIDELSNVKYIDDDDKHNHDICL